ncbi:DNA translocase FtsK [Brevibacillus laterosporus]|uniref:DNA translocase FtsK n=1 Tax=Brevibacillus laterosporus TaxID=1465 RepID=UPI002157F761|nr:DNA translocase FtsK [Brevibacillus laterosporus]MED1664531.1 DNA translocase FtsK [Brevibacillus laterosporus]MED1669981.1 DNA translocase FtsK [Brevibacillus laterosporus]MED1717310.1 DNA translocase FtsK [Brevibacillus laterosporus]MED1786506.1 DNA translocase FtsK [Brevibacillus laterosporus]
MNKTNELIEKLKEHHSNLYSDFEERYQEAVQIVKETKQCSVTMLQRKIRVGYVYAARIVDRMEKEGLVSPYRGSAPREVYI